MKWLITYRDGRQEIVEAWDFLALHDKIDMMTVLSVVYVSSDLL